MLAGLCNDECTTALIVFDLVDEFAIIPNQKRTIREVRRFPLTSAPVLCNCRHRRYPHAELESVLPSVIAWAPCRVDDLAISQKQTVKKCEKDAAKEKSTFGVATLIKVAGSGDQPAEKCGPTRMPQGDLDRIRWIIWLRIHIQLDRRENP